MGKFPTRKRKLKATSLLGHLDSKVILPLLCVMAEMPAAFLSKHSVQHGKFVAYKSYN